MHDPYAPKLSVVAACNALEINRDRFNEHVAAGNFPCAPSTVPGRTRYFDPDDMLALALFKRFLDDDIAPRRAGQMACSIAAVAREYPDAKVVAYVFDYFKPSRGTAYLPEHVPTHDEWDSKLLSGVDIREVRYYRIGKERELVKHYTAVERSYHGAEDE